MDRSFGNVSLGASWQAVSRSYDDVANEQEITGYGLLGLRSSWQATPELKLGLRLDNMFDKEYSRASYDHDFDGQYDAFREEGRTALASVTWTPGL
ncbi:Vitamin B12 transporter BtuB [compost metagenome]